jgi:hypothetical protein
MLAAASQSSWKALPEPVGVSLLVDVDDIAEALVHGPEGRLELVLVDEELCGEALHELSATRAETRNGFPDVDGLYCVWKYGYTRAAGRVCAGMI